MAGIEIGLSLSAFALSILAVLLGLRQFKREEVKPGEKEVEQESGGHDYDVTRIPRRKYKPKVIDDYRALQIEQENRAKRTPLDR